MLLRVSHLQANPIYPKLLYIRQSRHKRALTHRGKLNSATYGKPTKKQNVTASKNASAKNQHRQRGGIKGVNTRRSRGSRNIRDDMPPS